MKSDYSLQGKQNTIEERKSNWSLSLVPAVSRIHIKHYCFRKMGVLEASWGWQNGTQMCENWSPMLHWIQEVMIKAYLEIQR